MIYLLLAKAEQLGLFDSIVHVAPHVRKDGTYVAEHDRHQKVRQGNLFGAAEKPAITPTKAKARRLMEYVKRKGGAERMGSLLASQPAEVVARLVEGFVKETGLSAGQVRAVLGLGGERKEAAPAPADQEPIKNEKPSDAGLAAESAPADQEPVKKPEPAAPNPTQGKHEVPLDSVLVQWKPRFRGSVQPQYPTLAAKQADKVFRHVGSVDQLRLDASVRFMGQDPSPHAIAKIQRMQAAQKAGYSMKKVKVGTQGVGVIFVRDGRVLTPAGADALVSGIYDREQVEETGDHERDFSARLNADAKMLARWMGHLPESTLESPSAFAAKLNSTQVGQYFKIERDRHGSPVISSRDDKGEWRFFGSQGEGYQDALRKLVHFAAGDASQHWASQSRAADAAASESKAAGKSLKDVLRESGFEPQAAAEPVTVQAATPGEEHAIPPAAEQSPEPAPSIAAEAPSTAGGMDQRRVYLDVPFREKDRAKMAGAEWDSDQKLWFATKGDDGQVNPRLSHYVPDAGTNGRQVTPRLKAAALNHSIATGEPYEVRAGKLNGTGETVHYVGHAETGKAAEPMINSQVEPVAQEGPKEGDTKTIAGIEYRLQDGRWHRVTPEERAAAEDAATEPAQAPVAQLVEHVTKKGKTLRGIIRTDLTKEQAQAIDAYTFRKDGGWFIREKHLETAAAINTAHANGHITDEQRQVAQAANAEGGPAAAKETLARDLIAKKAAKLREAGQKLAEQAAEDRNRDRLTNTARRARMAAGAEAEAAQREAIGKTMMKLADALETGEVPALAGVTTRAAIEQLDAVMRSAMQRRENGLSYADSQRQKGRPFDDVDLRHVQMPRALWRDGDKSSLIVKIAGKRGAVALKAEILREPDLTQAIYDKAKAMIGEKELLNTVGWYAPEQLKKVGRLERAGITSDEKLREVIDQFRRVKAGKVEADPVKMAERAIIGQKVGIDFFPTPMPLAERMAQLAGVEPGARVLEPSAGNGNLADAAKAAGAAVDTVEVSDALRKILEAKGHTLAGRDFESFEPEGGQYDAVIMNPPFSNRQDAAHIMRAWDMVRPGGKLVAIAGEGVFFGTDAKAQAFRDWLDEHGADVEKLPAGSFEDKTLLATTSANARLIVLQKPGGPQEGDRKTVDGVEYVLEGGRWHRAMDPVPKPEPEAVAAEPEPEERRPDPEAELAEDREDLREEMMRDPHSERAQELVRQIAAKEEAKETPQEAAPASPERKVRAPRSTDTPEDLDPNSPNYRYRDTGYIGGSRKELAAEQIKRASREGRRLRMTDIDWAGLEENPREAEQVITKSHLFGQVDWEALKAGGMDPGAGFLIDRIYAAVGTEPALQGPQSRQDYAIGLESLRDRLERCQTPEQVVAVLDEIQEEWEGTILTAGESDAYKAARELYERAAEAEMAERQERDRIFKAWQKPDAELSSAKWAQDKRTARGWKPDPELAAQIERLEPVVAAAHEAYMEWMADHPTRRQDLGNGRSTSGTEAEVASTVAYYAAEEIKKQARARNLIENPITRAWATLGPRFIAVMQYRRHKGSEAFAKHVATVRVGGVKDWSWAEKETVRTTAKKRDVSFQLRVADHFERVGGRPVSVESTQALKDQFGLRDVQSGNWVLKDPKSAEFHVQRTAEAFADLADLLGVPESQVSANGRLAMAFGARGKGNAGWRGAAQAQYDGVYRVINLTKMGGGGALGHEWWHAIDNLMKEAEGTGAAGKDDYATENPDLLPAGDLKDAVLGLRDAMLAGPHRATERMQYSARDLEVAKHNIDGYYANSVAKVIKAAKNAEEALAAVDQYFSGRNAPTNKKQASNYARWRTLAVAFHDGNPAGGEVHVKSGQPMSSYALEAWKLDEGNMGKYWSQRSEMAARAFQSWIEDRLAAKGQRNDYLSVYADNKYHVHPLFGPQFPYPDGEERERINAAFDRLAEVMRKQGTLAKAFVSVA